MTRRFDGQDEPDISQVLDRFLDRLAAELADRVERRLDRLQATRQADGPQGLDIKQAAARLGVSPTTMHEMVMSGAVPSVKVGRRRLVAASTIDRLLAGDQIRGPIGDQLGGIRRDGAARKGRF
jgi:excisionase family DNA binding protein